MNMKKTAVSSAIAVGLGISTGADALQINISNMIFGATYGAVGQLFDPANSHPTFGLGLMLSTEPFNGNSWSANAVAFFDTHSQPLTWTGTFGGSPWAQGTATGTSQFTTHNPFSVTSTKTNVLTQPGFHLTDNQVAWGTLFNWSTSTNIPVLVVMDCPSATATSACTGIAGTPMAAGPFQGADPVFNGTLATGSVPFSGNPVPVPAAAWLFGSGLVGLAGIARRRRQKG